MGTVSNVVVMLGGGPTPVINNSLRAVVETCRAMPDRFGTVYGAWHGIEGILKEELLDLSAQSAEEIALLRTTPAAGAIGTTRYKLNAEEDMRRVVEVFRSHGVGYFFAIGGNDTQEVALRVAEAAEASGLDVVAIGIPKTIDNDLGDPELQLVDHTPGYGSVARYWAWTVQALEEENRGSSPADPVLVVQAMGRRVGFIPAAARLADPERETPLLVFLPEREPTLEELTDHVADLVRRRGRAVVVVSEGLALAAVGARHDAFGHAAFSSAETTVAQRVVNHLNTVGLPARGLARGQVPGTEQRHAILYASPVDLDEAYQVAHKAVLLAVEGADRVMATIRRAPGAIYRSEYDAVPLAQVATKDRPFPKAWIAPSGTDVTDEFVRYAQPLLGEDFPAVPVVAGRLRFARLKPVFAEKRLPDYVPAAHRAPQKTR
ncbi:diphosphate--fructose-6-phosphate 1-phosphotransferase [Candidatus Bipolaricaulota bacterium]|nr:diphosphate--fructose-6-phosphate 1-phosphotransferase [Candidatus Bipolaricaulota bacterium]